MNYLHQFLHFILHIDVYLAYMVNNYGLWTYLALFAVIFCETGLVVTPFLPGDSLLFAAGSLSAQATNDLSVLLLACILILASILGNQVNYLIGLFIGPKLFNSDHSLLFNKQHLTKTHAFYEQHGSKTIVFARFLPIIRTFAPFVAGIGQMPWVQFSLMNISSAVLWIGSLLGFGYFFGSLPVIQTHFSLVVYGIIMVSMLPVAITWFRSGR